MRSPRPSPRRAPAPPHELPRSPGTSRRIACLAALAVATKLVLGATAARAQPLRTIDLATTATTDGELRRVHAWTGNGGFGVPVAGTLDCDGDGARDYAMASMVANVAAGNAAGEVYLVFGDGTTGGTLDTAHVQASILRITGAGARETAGSELWMDDVTGDGLGDLLIARQNFRPDDARPGAGALTIVVGGPELRTLAATLATLDLAAPDPSITLTTFVGAEAIDRLGIWMRTGDVTGDGIADIVVGADQEDAPGESDNGAAYVIRGGPSLASAGTIDLAEFGSTVLAGDIARIAPPTGSIEYHFGATCQIADLDGNGRAEVLVAAALNRAGASIGADGAPNGTAHSAGGAPDGEVYIAWDDNFTGDPWSAGFTFAIDSAPGTVTTIRGGSRSVSFGEEMLGGRDYDGDSLADLFVGDIVGDWSGRTQSGSGHVIYDAAALTGLDFSLDALPPGVTMTTFLGGGVGDIAADTALHGDFDGDGIDDLAFSSPHSDPLGRREAGTLHVFLGQIGPFPGVVDLAPGALPPVSQLAIVEIYGAAGDDGTDGGDTLAYSAAAGDVDDDGRVDIIINEMLGNGLAAGAEDVGTMIIVSGDLVAGNDDSPGCSPAPLPGCRMTDPNKSRLRIFDRSPNGRDRFRWRWARGAATAASDWGDPLLSSGAIYRICMYDESGATQPLTDAAVPAGGTCGRKPCWRLAGSMRYKFADGTGRHSGTNRIALKAGAAGKAAIHVKARGAAFTTPGPPAALPLTVQLRVPDGETTQCWETVFSAATVNEPGRLRARGP